MTIAVNQEFTQTIPMIAQPILEAKGKNAGQLFIDGALVETHDLKDTERIARLSTICQVPIAVDVHNVYLSVDHRSYSVVLLNQF